MRKIVLGSSLLAGVVCAAHADMRVIWTLNGDATAIHRFDVTGEGTDEETWTETTPLVNFSGKVRIGNVFPAHGCYYVCFYGNVSGSSLKYNKEVHRYAKDGTFIEKVGTFPTSVYHFEMSADQA